MSIYVSEKNNMSFFTQIYGCMFSSGLKSSYFLSFNDFENIVKTKLNVSFSNSMNVLETAFDIFS